MLLIKSPLQGAIVKDPSISVSCVSWSPDGNLIGMSCEINIALIGVHLCFSIVLLLLLQGLHLQNT
jgi:hypothetical protein